MNQSIPLLQASEIRKSFSGVSVLHGVNLTVHPGQVLALLGENGAGKSTLVKILAGDHRPDSGTISVAGKEYSHINPGIAKNLGIRMIFQELNDASTLTVAENIFLGEWPTRGGFISWKTVREEAQRTLDALNANIDVDAKISTLRVGERQLVEIARATRTKARVLILDEPTAALSSTEVEQLFHTVRVMRNRGVGMIYITHRLDEVLEIADNVQVLRDGCSVLEARVATVDRQKMVSAMIGRDATAVARPTEVELGTTSVLSVSNLTLEREFSDVNLDIRGGEILALYGKIGSGTAEVAEALFGLHPATQGTVTLKSQPLEMTSPNAAIKQGIGFLPPDRQRSGSFAPRSVAENLAAPSWAKLARRGILSHSAEREAYERWRGKLNIRSTADSRQAIINLSGGNQQKVLLARWLERDVDLLLLVEPTRGVDVGARIDIYNAVRDLAKSNGLAVLVVTSDYEEVIQLSDRALVMVAGRITDELTGDAVTAKALTGASGG